jgi:hypothetical protein
MLRGTVSSINPSLRFLRLSGLCDKYHYHPVNPQPSDDIAVQLKDELIRPTTAGREPKERNRKTLWR